MPIAEPSAPAKFATDWTEQNSVVTARPARRRTARHIVVGAIACGIAGDLLVHGDGPTVPAIAYCLLVGAFASWLVIRSQSSRRSPIAYGLIALSTVFSLWMLVHDADLLAFWNMVTSLSMLALALYSSTPMGAILTARVRDYFAAATHIVRYAAADAIGFIGTDARDVLPASSLQWRATRLFVRGAIIAVIVATVFATLLSLGDQVFARTLENLVHWDVASAATHLLGFVAFAWPVTGVLWGTTIGARSHVPADEKQWHALNRIDVLSVLIGMNVLFAAFVAVQLRVLFGGIAYVYATTGLTLAQYARNGFFVLFATGGLVLVLLLTLNAMLRDGRLATWAGTRRLSSTLIAMVGLMLISSATRMTLYVQSFGASTDRLYAFGAMIWLACVFVWFRGTVLANRPRRFAFGALMSACAALFVFNVINPDAMVARYNVARARAGAPFDLVYAGELHADAVPTIVEAISAVPLQSLETFGRGGSVKVCQQVQRLVDRYTKLRSDGRFWSVSRSRAARAMSDNRVALNERSCAG